MKKITVLLLLILTIAGCQMYQTKEVAVDNNSDHIAIIRVENFKEGDKKILSSTITIPAHKSILLPMYHDGNITLKAGRNQLKTISNTRYEILNAGSVQFTIYNKTDFPVVVSDLNNLFDTQNIGANTNIPNVNVYNMERIQPRAITNNGAILKVHVYERNIIVSY